MKKKKKLHRYAKAGHRFCQPNVDNDTSIQSESGKYDGVEIVGKSADELNEEIAAKIDVCENNDNSLRIDFYPFAYSLHDEQLSSRCWYCLAKVDTLKRCHACRKGMFCNEKCQILGWKDHRSECKAFKSHDAIANIEVRLLGRIVTRYKAIKLGKDKEDNNFYKDRTSKRSIMDIWSHTDLIKKDPAAMTKFNGIYADLLAFYGSKAMVSRDEVFELHCRNYINRHAISDCGYIEEIGKGLYLDLCAYDHSCRPNAIYTCNSFVATLRGLTANVDLRNLSSTYYSYIDLINTTQQRRKLLKDTWYFECHCTRCDDPDDALLSSILCPNCPKKRECLRIFGDVPYKDRNTQIITCPKCYNKVSPEYVIEAIAAMRFIDKIVENREVEKMSREQSIRFLTDLKKRFSELLSNVNVFLCKVIQLLIPLIDISDCQLLLDLHLEAEECVRFCFPYNHPAVGIHYRNIATFYLKCKQPHRSLLYCKKAYEVVKFTLGSKHPMTIETDAMLKDASREVQEAKKLIFGTDTNIRGKCNGTEQPCSIKDSVVVNTV
ncbi:MYND finger family protein [Brugia malayi]|uniref:BMA-SET-30 n=1 Tax=Brugia malayi TaxID=6279 RepID=A0A0I9N4M1_BRUMA|nr:MYND finger family protein [Brugia malayi]CTP80940.1 BMA-SET-30 [Brugia malayi]VIO87670.1 MYND finger family protein [Brugia malayi]